ncbi:hypothetical protein OROMI_006074 [Orobanche minor]
MDREIPALMGVSKAILENVIFVHQDEANWPLQDPSTLKKKFDDIFSATRYTKALEVIKKLHKDQAQDIKTYKLKLEHLHTLKDAAFKLRDSIVRDEEKTKTLNNQMQELDIKIQNMDREINQTEVQLKDLRKLKHEIATKSGERKSKHEEMENRHVALEIEYEETDEQLIEWKSKFDGRIATLEAKIIKLLREKEDIEGKIRVRTEMFAKNVKDIANLQAAIEAHVVLKNERDLKIQSLFRKHNLGSFPSGSFSNEVALNLTNRIHSKMKFFADDLKEKKSARLALCLAPQAIGALIASNSNEEEVAAALGQYLHARNRWNEINAQKEAKEEIKGSILGRIQDKKSELDSLEIQIAAFDVTILDEREKYMQIEVERRANQLNARDFETTIRQKQLEKFKLDQEIDALSKERDAVNADSHDRVAFSLKKADLETYKKKHRRIVDECKERIRGVLKGRIPPDKDLKNEIVQVQRVFFAGSNSLKKEYDELEKKADEAKNEMTMLKLKIQEGNGSLSKFRKDLESRRRFIESKLQSFDQQSGGIDSYLKMLETAKEKRDIQISEYNVADGMRRMFDPFERVARAHHICPCCDRPFSANEEDEFVKKQRVKAASSAEHLKVLAEDSSNAEFHFQQLDELRMVYEEYVKTGKESIPLAEKNLNQLNEELEQKSHDLDDVLGVLAQVKTEKDPVDDLIQPVETADRLFQEIQILQRQVSDLESKLDFQSQGVKSIGEIQLELKNLERTRNNLIADLDKLRVDQSNMKEDLSSLHLRWNIIRDEKTKVASLLSNIKRVEEELDRLAEEKSQFELNMKLLAESLGSLSKEEKKLHDDHINLKVKRDAENEVWEDEYRKKQQEVDALVNLLDKIKDFDNTKEDKLNALQEKQTQLGIELKSCETRMKEILEEVENSGGVIQKQAIVRRNIDDNLEYRKLKARVDGLLEEIDSLETRSLQIGGLSQIEAMLLKLSQERESLLTELNKHRGTLSVFTSNIDRNIADLKQPQYKDIDRHYFDQLIQLKTTEMANKDLDRYYKALDKALMRFHTIKMEEINKIIRELWQQTYRGQDIDYISIHSDSDGAGTRSYSYKVLMQTGDAQLEMRGRCSAGQKVLASLLIRLALAETFCLNCGILALDEPTTNLDAPNSESLASALLRIMVDRKGQENFQLIVITHDERFAQLIGQRQHAEKYYRITKDD